MPTPAELDDARHDGWASGFGFGLLIGLGVAALAVAITAGAMYAALS